MPRVLLELTGNYVRRAVYGILLIGGVGGGWWVFTPHARPVYVHPTTNAAIQEACGQLVKALPRPEVGLEDTLVLPFANDRKGDGDRELVAEAVREAVSEHGGYKIVDVSATDWWRDWAGKQLNLDWLKTPPVLDKDTAVNFAKWADADFVMIGKVLKLVQPNKESPDEPAIVQFSVRMFDVKSLKCVLEKNFDNKATAKPETPVDRLAAVPTNKWYGAGVFLFAALWPLSLTSMMRRVVRMENNQVTLFTLLSIIAVPVALAWPWAFGASAGVWRTILFVIGAVVIALWCSFVMSRVAEMNKY